MKFELNDRHPLVTTNSTSFRYFKKKSTNLNWINMKWPECVRQGRNEKPKKVNNRSDTPSIDSLPLVMLTDW